jgi:hypothetical protein
MQGACSHVIMNHLATTPSELPSRTDGHDEVRPLVVLLAGGSGCARVSVLKVCTVS